jgi:hypothetical protein
MSANLSKNIVRIIREKPGTFRGSQHEWTKLVKSMIIPPDKDYEWVKDKETKEWHRIKL